MKRCCDCGQEKPLGDFNRNASKADGLQTRCRECQRADSKTYYQANRTRMRRQIIAARVRRRSERQQFVLDYLRDHPCVDCGEADLLVLDFDHVRGIKVASVTDFIGFDRPIEALVAEIAKCDVRCSNCHRRKTLRDRGSYRCVDAPLAQLARVADS